MRLAHSRTPKEAEGRRRRAQFPRKTTARRVWGAIGAILESTLESIKGADCLRTEKMFPSHLSVNDLGVFAVVMVFGLIVVLLFMFDFVSLKLYLLLTSDFVFYGCRMLRVIMIRKTPFSFKLKSFTG